MSSRGRCRIARRLYLHHNLKNDDTSLCWFKFCIISRHVISSSPDPVDRFAFIMYTVHSLTEWRREHVEEIDETLGGSDRKAALYGLLEKETKLVAAIDVHKNKARQGNEEKSVQRYLEKVSYFCCLFQFHSRTYSMLLGTYAE